MTAKDTSAPLESLGSYDLIEKIADGSTGSVFKARHWQSKEVVAIKLMTANLHNAVLLKRFEQEFRIASKLDHPNIVRVLEYCGTGPSPYLVMEFVEGESVGRRLERGRFSEEEALAIIVQVGYGLQRAHRQGLIHRDVKPDNILLTPEGKAKLTDLGLAKKTHGNTDLTRTGRGLGTPTFMAPEQFRNAKNASIRCDVYSLGATLYQMVTGELPFEAAEPVQAMMLKLRNQFATPRQHVPQLSERTERAILRAMNAQPLLRPASCREFVDELLGEHFLPATCPDFGDLADDLWHLRFTDRAGQPQQVAAYTQELRQFLQAGELHAPHAVEASRCRTGPFTPLLELGEFRDLATAVPAPEAEKPIAEGPPPAPLPLRQPHSKLPGPAVPTGTAYAEQADSSATPHFQFAAPAEHHQSEGWKTILALALVALATTLIASKFLLPLLR